MTRTARFWGGLRLGYVNLVVLTVGGIWLTRFFLQRLGPHEYGLWLVNLQLIAYLMLLDVGVVALLPREVAYATGRGGAADTTDGATLDKIVNQTASIVLWQTPAIAVITAMLWFWLPAGWQELRKPLAMMLPVLVLLFPLRVFQAALRGLQDLSYLAKLQLAAWIGSTVLTIVLVVAGFGLFALGAGWIALQLITVIACGYRMRAELPRLWPDRLPRVSWQTIYGRIARGLWVSVGEIAHVLVNGTDVLIIGTLLGPAAVVPFVCTGKLIAVLSNQPQLLMHTAGPALSELKAGSGRERLGQVTAALTQATLTTSGLIACVVVAVNQGFVGWWVGADQYGGLVLTITFVGGMLLRHWNTTAMYSLFCFGYERRIALTALLDGGVTVAASVVGARALGPIGAPLGSILGVCLVSLPANLSALTRETGSSMTGFMHPLWSWFTKFSAVLAVAVVLAIAWQPLRTAAIAGTAATVAVIYSLVMLPSVLRPPLGVYVAGVLPFRKAMMALASIVRPTG